MNEDRDNDAAWDEFRWEQVLKEGDEGAAKYFRLLNRFADLPAAEELISERMGPDFDDEMPDCDFDCEECANRWNCEYCQPLDWETLRDDEEDEEEDDDDTEDASPPEPGDALFFETRPAFRSLRQVGLGWCNVYAVILPAESRANGLKVLYYLGRALAYLSCSIGDGLYEYPARSVAFAKRALASINLALGVMEELVDDKPQLDKLLQAMRKHLLVARQASVDHLHKCRKRLKKE
jgi:hypothetical protein